MDLKCVRGGLIISLTLRFAIILYEAVPLAVLPLSQFWSKWEPVKGQQKIVAIFDMWATKHYFTAMTIATWKVFKERVLMLFVGTKARSKWYSFGLIHSRTQQGSTYADYLYFFWTYDQAIWHGKFHFETSTYWKGIEGMYNESQRLYIVVGGECSARRSVQSLTEHLRTLRQANEWDRKVSIRSLHDRAYLGGETWGK